MSAIARDELPKKAKKGQDVEGRSTTSEEELAVDVATIATSEQPPSVLPTGNWLHDHMLSVVLVSLFLLTLIGQLYFQYQHEVAQAIQHGEPAPTWLSKDFWNAFLASVFENWQSEFLQLASFVIFATYMIHRGSPQSRDNADEMAADIKAIRKKLDA
ncbi:MAG: DUF6766 family protein, partial [Acidimicrobiia bacterium]